LLERLATGVPLQETEAEHIEKIDALFKTLHSKMWQQRISIFDWALFGYFKGLFCGLLRQTGGDPWIIHCGSKLEILSKSIDLQIEWASERELAFRCSYKSRLY
jgi:hypothetical protein